MNSDPVRWGIISTANIARGQFLPGLREAGGVPAAVAGRDLGRAQAWAEQHGVDRAVAGYQALIDDPDIDALYVPLPNSLHAEWTMKALRAGKPVLCEKPLCGTLAEAEQVLAVAKETGTLLWEAFVFPFHAQFAAVQKLLADGTIGELLEIQADFHFMVRNPANIRLARDLDGGALNDVGCYPVRIALELFGAGHTDAWATAVWGGHDVDLDTQGSLGFPGGRRLLLTCGMRRAYDTFTRLLGTTGQIQLTNPFHPGPADTLTVLRPGAAPLTEHPTTDQRSFTAAIRHIHAVLRGESAPRHTAAEYALPAARVLEQLQRLARPAGEGR
jgi:predicted dehydrogenase